MSDLLDGPGIYNALEINIRPADPEADHYEMEWHILTEHNGKLTRAIDLERTVRKDRSDTFSDGDRPL